MFHVCVARCLLKTKCDVMIKTYKHISIEEDNLGECLGRSWMDLGMTDFYLLMFSDCGEADYSDQIPPLYPPEMSPFVAVK